MWRCPRVVSTVLCVHKRLCQPEDCNQHGTCVDGQCVCQPGWPTCANLTCQHSACVDHGLCTPGDFLHLRECVCSAQMSVCSSQIMHFTYISVLCALQLYQSVYSIHVTVSWKSRNRQKKSIRMCVRCYAFAMIHDLKVKSATSGYIFVVLVWLYLAIQPLVFQLISLVQFTHYIIAYKDLL